MNDVKSYLKLRGPLLGLSATLGLLSTLFHTRAPSPDEAGLRVALEKKTELTIESFVWGKSQGVLRDYVLGRPLVFLGKRENQLGDIYRLQARLSPEGRVLGLSRAHNLSTTRLGEEYGLTGNHGVALFGTRTPGGEASASLLDLGGAKAQATGPLETLQIALRNLLSTGSLQGLGRTDLFFSEGKIVELSLDQSGKVLSLPSALNAPVEVAALLSPSKTALPDLTEAGIRIVPRKTTPEPWLHFAADAGRSLLGSGAIAWAEGRAFSLFDGLHRVGYQVVSGGPLPSPPSQNKKTPTVKTNSSAKKKVWPPAPLTFGRTKEEDGTWKAVVDRLLPSEPEALFYRTVLHPDPARPYAELHLVAMDMRRLQLGIGAGYEDPHPDTGPPGSGQLPLPAARAKNVVATFNGAFKAIHGRYGMKAEERLLVAPVHGAATVVVDGGGRAGFGTWEKETDPEEFHAFRQNLEPLVENGVANPQGRKVWGEHLYGVGVAVERSALCLHESGQLLYAWATEATGESLAKGLSLAGCTYALHLDMNPGHCSFLFNKVESLDPMRAQGRPLDPRMKVNPTRFLRWSPKDFFFLERTPNAPTNPGITWTVAPGTSPSPSYIPGIFQGSMKLGELQIELDRVNAGRLTYRALPGKAENPRRASESLSESRSHALIAWGLGHGTRGSRTGLSMNEETVVPLHRKYASLVIREDGLDLRAPAEPQTEDSDLTIVQLPVLARDGALVPESRELGGSGQRAALCVDPAGNLLVARMVHDTPAPLAQALLDLGCDLVVEMDRGSHTPPLVERAGTSNPPRDGYEQTMLYGLNTDLSPRTFEF